MTIRHSRGAYEIRSHSLSNLLAGLPPSSFILTDANVRAAVGEDALRDTPTLCLPPGEESKSLATYGRGLSWLAERGASRKSTLVALGGGVIGDLGGFLAATYMRGIPFVQIPTTLLAQVDSSVGGKVGIDLPEGKNLVGAFYPPAEVRLCVDILARLPERQRNNGMAEVWKYAAIMDRDFFEAIPKADMEEIVRHCIALKKSVVEADEFETNGLRAILNFGHTVGHAVESLTGYGPILHGEAIAIGMVVEGRLGDRIGITERGVTDRLQACLQRQGLPITHPILKDVDAMLAAMRRDKKAAMGRLAFSLLTEIGGCKLIQDVNEADVRAVLMEG